MTSNRKTACVILSFAAVFLVMTMLAQSCAEEGKKRNHLEYFTKVDGPSVSSDGNQLTFDGCGHKDYAEYTIYRYDRKGKVLYRYVHPDPSMQVLGAEYFSDSQKFLLSLIPRGRDRKQLIEDMQVAIMNPDGTGLKQLTQGKGVKAAYMLSPDGNTLVYAKGKERTEGKTIAAHFDYYALDLKTGKETQITRLSFYEVTTPYFTPDGKNVVFIYGSAMRLPHTEDWKAVDQFHEAYTTKHQRNLIIQYPVDGSGISRLPEPWFSHGVGSEDPAMTRDGSLWFQGITGGNRRYRRYPGGEITVYTDEELAEKRSQCIFRMAVNPVGRWAAILFEDLGGEKKRDIRIFDASTRKCDPISLPDTATNITIR